MNHYRSIDGKGRVDRVKDSRVDIILFIQAGEKNARGRHGRVKICKEA
jgi:hypothetical protein